MARAATAKKPVSKARRSSPKTKTAKRPKIVLAKPGDEKLRIPGLEEIAKEIRRRDAKITKLAEEQKAAKAVLIATVSKARRKAEKADGEDHHHCLVTSADGTDVKVIFVNKFSEIDLGYEAAIKKALGKKCFDALFSHDFKLKIKKDTDLAALKKALGNKFDAFAALVGVTSFFKPGSDYLCKRAALRLDDTVSSDVQTDLDDLVDQVIQNPQVKTK